MRIIDIRGLRPLVKNRSVNLYAFRVKDGYTLNAYRRTKRTANDEPTHCLKAVNGPKQPRVFKTADSLLSYLKNNLWGESVTFI